ncbi:uncharacterized protein LOC129221322 [Uloborus diversus]|uniref:uncharacterized protein LOC129221322 n=1 Tax=Uloborus diversus TaxID=327109 RepID=UPI002409B525|nr:uncharacterized protein LOC129221322 [Uloborus diversus]
MVAATEFPNPQKEWRLCGRYKPSFVCDPDFILERGDAERLDHLADDFRRSTSCMCRPCSSGISVGIFIKSNLSQESLEKYPDAKDLAETIRRRWSLGFCNDDIVIVLVTHLQMVPSHFDSIKSDFSMGSAVKNILAQEKADEILRDCRIHFESGWYYQGLESMVNSFNDILIQLQKERNGAGKGLIVGIALGTGMFLVLTVTAVVLLCRQSQRRKEYCDDILEKKPMKTNRKQLSKDNEEKHQLEKLKDPINSDGEGEDDDDDDEILSSVANSNNFSSLHFSRVRRQLSDITEVSTEECDTPKGDPSSLPSLYHTPSSYSHNLQITEL